MRTPNALTLNCKHLVVVAVFSGWMAIALVAADAQTTCAPQTIGVHGQNAVVASASGGITPASSFAFVDAGPYASDSRCPSGVCDICGAINLVLCDYHMRSGTHGANGVVVDARGINPGATQSCSATPGNPGGGNPWGYLTIPPQANTVLLPAGTIQIPVTWTLLADTRLIGQGPNTTIIEPGTGFLGGGEEGNDIIDMVPSSPCATGGTCFGVAIEHLGLNGVTDSNSLNGIVNIGAQELSHVSDVSLAKLGGTGLWLSGFPFSNSGPYSNISYSGNGICAQIYNNLPPTMQPATDTRGIHGLTCNMSGLSPAAIYVDGPNQTLEDIQIQGSGSSQDGILIGSQADAESDLLFNIKGSGLASVVHISSQVSMSGVTPPSNCPQLNSTQPNNVCDLTLLGISGSGVISTIRDDLTNPTTPNIVTDPTVGMYVVGEQVLKGTNTFLGYSRFTTSRSVPTWLVGSADPTGAGCATGSLYSETSGSYALLACKGGIWVHIN